MTKQVKICLDKPRRKKPKVEITAVVTVRLSKNGQKKRAKSQVRACM